MTIGGTKKGKKKMNDYVIKKELDSDSVRPVWYAYRIDTDSKGKKIEVLMAASGTFDGQENCKQRLEDYVNKPEPVIVERFKL